MTEIQEILPGLLQEELLQEETFFSGGSKVTQLGHHHSYPHFWKSYCNTVATTAAKLLGGRPASVAAALRTAEAGGRARRGHPPGGKGPEVTCIFSHVFQRNWAPGVD